MRKYMTKEVTTTTIRVGKVVLGENNMPVVEELTPITVLGNLSQDRAQRRVNKDLGMGISIFGLEVTTHNYKMKVTDFIKVAELVTENDTTLDEEEETE